MFVGRVADRCGRRGTFPVVGLLLLLHTRELSVQLYHSCGIQQLYDDSLLICDFLHNGSKAVTALCVAYGQAPEELSQQVAGPWHFYARASSKALSNVSSGSAI